MREIINIQVSVACVFVCFGREKNELIDIANEIMKQSIRRDQTKDRLDLEVKPSFVIAIKAA
jgi:hypothetical protein